MDGAREADSTSPGAFGPRLLAAVCRSAAGALVLDALLFLATARDAGLAWRDPLLPRAALVAAAAGAALAGAAGLCAALVPRARAARGLGAGLLAGALAAQAELVLARFEAASRDPRAAWPSLVLGVAVGLAVALACGRARAVQRARPARAAALLAALVLAALALARARAPREPAPLAHPTPASAKRVPRVILIVADTLRADALGAAAGEGGTPHLERLAADAWRFDAARAAAPWTLPSMATLLTGLSPLVHGARGRWSALPAAIPTLAEAFAEAGYDTAAFGHNPVLSRARGLDRGFREYGFLTPPAPPGRSLGVALLRRSLEREALRHERADALAARATSWVEAHADEAFFLWLHFYDPHLAYAPPPELRPPGPPPPGFGPTVGFAALERVRGGYLVPDGDGRRWVRALYEGEVRFLDRELGRLLDRLRALGLYDDSLIAFTSDHGEELWEHGGLEHGHTSYEELLRVPLLVKPPRGAGGRREAGVVAAESLAPTLLALCGIPFDPARFDGPALLGPEGERAPAAPADALAAGALYFEDRLALLFDGWKYVRHRESGREELYDLSADPGESADLRSARPERLAEARARVAEHLARAQARREALGVGDAAAALGAGELDALRDIGYVDR